MAAKLDGELWAKLGWASTLKILNTEIPEGSPWEAEWATVSDGTCPPYQVLVKITAGGVRAWLMRHPEVVQAEGIEL